MRDGNLTKSLEAIFVNTVFELPMRDGNRVQLGRVEGGSVVFELPMRDGNHFAPYNMCGQE